MRRRVDLSFFFFQAEDGIRDKLVTGVQTCALPICSGGRRSASPAARASGRRRLARRGTRRAERLLPRAARPLGRSPRSEEHTSELQSLAYLVCRLLLEKKKNTKQTSIPQLRSRLRANQPPTT